MSFKAWWRQLTVLTGVILTGLSAYAYEEEAHPGYLDDVQGERHQITREVVIVPPLEGEGIGAGGGLLSEKLTKDFSREFRNRFGNTEFDQISVTSNRFVGDSQAGRLVPVNEYIDRQESFGQYMVKEIAEYHIDGYLKGNKGTRGVYKAKEALSNFESSAVGDYKFKFRYKIASNRMTLKFEKPKERFHNQIDVKGDGTDATVRVAYDVSKTIRLSSDYAISDEMTAIRAEKRLTRQITTSITGQSYKKYADGIVPQEKILLGLSWWD